MRDFLPVLRVLGLLIALFGVGMLLPWGVSWAAHDGVTQIYPWCVAATVGTGLLLWVGLRHQPHELHPRHGVMLVALTWILLPLFGLCVELVLLGAGLDGVEQHNAVETWICFGILILIGVIAFLIAVLSGHRWWCLIRRWLQYVVLGPTVVVMIVSAFNF